MKNNPIFIQQQILLGLYIRMPGKKSLTPKLFSPGILMHRPSWICCYMKIGWFFILGPHANIFCFAWQMSTFYSPLWVDYNHIIPNLSMIMRFLCYFRIENGQCINLDDSFWLFNSIHAQWSLQSLTGKSVRQSQKKRENSTMQIFSPKN